MKRFLQWSVVVVVLFLLRDGSVDGRGFGGGGYRAGGFSAGAYRGGSYSGYRGGSAAYAGYRGGSAAYSGYRGGSAAYAGYRGGSVAYSGYRGGSAAYGSYDRSYSGPRGGSVNVEGSRGAVSGPYGGFAAGGQREVTATGPGGRSYSGSHEAGVAAGPYGRVVGGSTRAGVASGPYGSVAGVSRAGFAGARMPTDFGMAHYSAFNTAGLGHSTAYWSHGAVTTRAGYVRTGFGYYNTFNPNWYGRYPGAWTAANWVAASAWRAASWASLQSFCSFPPIQPIYYDYGNTIVYQDNSVYVDGQDAGTAPQYAQQAIVLANQGQLANAPPEEEWKSLGVFALVQGEEKSSNNLFQLALNKDGILRGNYYDGLMDSNTPIYGTVDKKTQRAAWTIGKKNDRVFETGVYNLTKSETSVLVHFGTDRTQQMLLVRMEQPDGTK